MGSWEVVNNSPGWENEDEARKFFFSKRKGECHQTIALVTSRVLLVLQEYENKSRQMTVQDFGCSVVWSTPLHLYCITLTLRCELAVAGNGKSRHSMRLRSSEANSYKEKHIAIRATTTKISGFHTRKFSFQSPILTRTLSLSWKLSLRPQHREDKLAG